MEIDYNAPTSPSFKQKLRQYSICFSCCFGRPNRHHHHLPSPPKPTDDSPALIWMKPESPNDISIAEIKEKCRSLLGINGNKHRRHSSTEFRYDPLSYSLNFEDSFEQDDAAPLKSFAARLPPSPPVAPAVN